MFIDTCPGQWKHLVYNNNNKSLFVFCLLLACVNIRANHLFVLFLVCWSFIICLHANKSTTLRTTQEHLHVNTCRSLFVCCIDVFICLLLHVHVCCLLISLFVCLFVVTCPCLSFTYIIVCLFVCCLQPVCLHTWLWYFAFFSGAMTTRALE